MTPSHEISRVFIKTTRKFKTWKTHTSLSGALFCNLPCNERGVGMAFKFLAHLIDSNTMTYCSSIHCVKYKCF